MRVAAAAGVILCASLLAGCRQPGFPATAAPGAAPTAAPVATAAPVGTGAKKLYVGVYEKGVPQSYRPVEKFARAIHRQPQLALYFSGWGERFQTAFAKQAGKHGAMPLVQMNPTNVSMAEIAAGYYDGYLRSFASQVRAYGKPVFIGFAHEMNGWWYSWGWTHTSPRVWVKAWRHVVTVFRDEGAANVSWLWTINRGVGGKMAPLRKYWPGASYVSWVGIDGYYFTPGQSFGSIIAPTVDAVRRITHKPIILGETAIGQVAGQAHRLPDLFGGIRKYHLNGFVWYDVAQHGGTYHQDWRLEGHGAALKVFRRELALTVRR